MQVGKKCKILFSNIDIKIIVDNKNTHSVKVFWFITDFLKFYFPFFLNFISEFDIMKMTRLS